MLESILRLINNPLALMGIGIALIAFIYLGLLRLMISYIMKKLKPRHTDPDVQVIKSDDDDVTIIVRKDRKS